VKPHILQPASAEERASIAKQAERRLSPEEFQAWVDAPVSEWERENTQALIRWFTTRYKTPLERLAYARRAYARQTAHLRQAPPTRT
jgi:hypothetical protein